MAGRRRRWAPSTALRGYGVFVSERRWAGSWLSGNRAAGEENGYPGQRFGLPEEGPRSVAGVGRRIGALFIDWLLCMIIAVAVFGSQYWTIAVFAVEVYVLTALTGFTVGKRILGLRVVRLDGKPVGLWWALLRTLLLLALVPPLVFDSDLRGLHDKAAETLVIRI
jgi:RDD family